MAFIVRDRNIEERDTTSVYLDDGSTHRITTCSSIYINSEEPIDECSIGVMLDVTKAREDECLVSGWASVSVNADGSIPLDWQGDTIRPEVLEKAAVNFMLDYRGSGEMHEGDSQGEVVESIVLTKEKQQAMGIPEGVVPVGWFITVKVKNPETFEKVKSGKYKMFSIQGTAKRVELPNETDA